MPINCTFVSVWDDRHEVKSACVYDPETGEVIPEVLDVDIDGVLTREYIILPDEKEIEVCMTCHSYVMKTIKGDRADLSYGEMSVCSDSECEIM